MNDGITPLEEKFDCENGLFVYAGKRLHDHEHYGVLSVEEIITHSSNIGAAKVGIKMGCDRFYGYMRNFGFGGKTGIPLIGEVSGTVHPVNRWTKLSISRIPMGHEVAVTPLQMVMAMSAVANGGRVMRPMLVDRLEDENGHVLVKNYPQQVRQAVNEQPAKLMVTALKTVVATTGPVKRRCWSTTLSAGKTGTAQKIVGGVYRRDKHFSSFIGFFPADILESAWRCSWMSRRTATTAGKPPPRFSMTLPNGLHSTWPFRPTCRRPLRQRLGQRRSRPTSIVIQLTLPRCNLSNSSASSTRSAWKAHSSGRSLGSSYDSRRITPGMVFVAMPGHNVDGHDYINSAIDRGATAVICERNGFFPERATKIKVADVREALAVASATFYQHPSGRLKLIGVTGTNGKTTVAFMVKHILESAGIKTGLIGTVRYEIGDRVLAGASDHARSVGGATDAFADAPSRVPGLCHGGQFPCLGAKASHGLQFDVGIFTNLTRDHLDYHGSMENYYFAAKKLLFQALERGTKRGGTVINIDDAFGRAA